MSHKLGSIVATFKCRQLFLHRPLNRISGVEFDDCYRQRIVHPIEGVQVNFISRDLLIQNKLASGWDKDLDDAKRLQKLAEPIPSKPKTRTSKRSASRKKPRSE